MLQSLFKRAEASVDNAIAGALGRVVIAIPFVVAGAFATASAAIYLNEELGPAGGMLAMAGIFAVIGLGTVAVVSYRMAEQPAGSTSQPIGANAQGYPDPNAALLDTADKELATDVIRSVAPLALPLVLRLAIRNLPLVAAAAAASFIISRTRPTPERGPVVQPAE